MENKERKEDKGPVNQPGLTKREWEEMRQWEYEQDMDREVSLRDD